jgi:hypothetical protein
MEKGQNLALLAGMRNKYEMKRVVQSFISENVPNP